MTSSGKKLKRRVITYILDLVLWLWVVQKCHFKDNSKGKTREKNPFFYCTQK